MPARLVTIPLCFQLICLECACPSDRPATSPEARAEEATTGTVAALPSERIPMTVEYLIADAGDIVAEVNSFDNIKTCVASLDQQLPDPLNAVLSDIGYGKATFDACSSVQALAEKNMDLCQNAQIRAAKLGCERRYAMYYGDPDLCPHQMGRTGREPFCVAVAMRDPSMCYAELSEADLGLCRAIVLRNERPCRVAHPTAKAAGRCAAAAKRWWKVIPPSRPRPRLPVDFTPSLRICAGEQLIPLVAGDGGTTPVPPDADSRGPERTCVDNPDLLRRGVVVGPEEVLVLGGRSGLPIGPQLPIVELRLALPLGELPATRSLDGNGGAAWIDLQPDAIQPEGQDCEGGEVVIEQFGLYRGALVSGSFQLLLAESVDGSREIRGTFTTFVRDVDGLEQQVP